MKTAEIIHYLASNDWPAYEGNVISTRMGNLRVRHIDDHTQLVGYDPKYPQCIAWETNFGMHAPASVVIATIEAAQKP